MSTKTSASSQHAMILKHLLDFRAITTWEAIKEYGCTRLSAVIYNLRKEGWNIVSKRETRKNRYGNSVSFARYTLISKD